MLAYQFRNNLSGDCYQSQAKARCGSIFEGNDWGKRCAKASSGRDTLACFEKAAGGTLVTRIEKYAQ